LSVSPLTISNAIKPVEKHSSGEEFELPNFSDIDDDSPQVGPTPERDDGLTGPLTPQSNTLRSATLDPNAPVTDIGLFYEAFINEDAETMRQCKLCP
jgi:hypothetical protein